MNLIKTFSAQYIFKIVIVTVIFVLLSILFTVPAYLLHLEELNPKAEYSEQIELSLDEIYENESLQSEKQSILTTIEELERAESRAQTIQTAAEYLTSRNSPMVPYLGIVYDQAEACGGNFQTLLGIAGKESSFGLLPYKLYNPYGYLNNVQYASWEEALTFLSCQISRQFIVPCNNDLQCIINRYGGPDTDQENWINSVKSFINQLET